MNGRSLHDALLKILCEAPLRDALVRDKASAAAALGEDEAAVLARADGVRLAHLARFMARHFYRERLVRLFRHSRAVLLRTGRDLQWILDDVEFRTVLGASTLGSAESAESVATAIEARCRAEADAARATGGGVPSYFEDLVRYEGTLFRVESGPRRWDGGDENGKKGTAPPRLAPSARLFELEHDLPPLLPEIEDPARPLPEAVRRPTRLLAALDPKGSVHVVRCPDGAARLLGCLDGVRTIGQSAAAAGLSDSEAEGVIGQLRGIGAVVP